MAGQGGRLGRHSLHHAAVAAKGVDPVVEQLEAGPVEALGKPRACDRHADAGRETLAEGSGGGLDARRPVVLGVAGAPGIELTETLQVVERDRWPAQDLVALVDRLHAREVEQRVEKRRGMAGREHEPVPIRPDRVLRIEAEKALPERVDHRGHGHRSSGMARVRLLDGVDAERADGGDGELVGIGWQGHGRLLQELDEGGRAATSARTRARSRRTRPAGMPMSPRSRRARAGAFSAPVTTQRIRRER